MKYCYNCRVSNNWPGGFMTAPEGPCEAPGHAGDRKVPCYQYDSTLLPGMPQNLEARYEAEFEKGEGGR